MLKIRQQQSAALQDRGYTVFIEQLDAYLIAEVPEHRGIARETRLKIIDSLLTIAFSYGLETEQHATLYVLAAWLCGFDFDQQHPQVAARLGSGNYSADEKAEWLNAWLEAQAQTS